MSPLSYDHLLAKLLPNASRAVIVNCSISTHSYSRERDTEVADITSHLQLEELGREIARLQKDVKQRAARADEAEEKSLCPQTTCDDQTAGAHSLEQEVFQLRDALNERTETASIAEQVLSNALIPARCSFMLSESTVPFTRQYHVA